MLPSASPRRASGLIALIALRLVAARALADDAARSARPPVADESVADARRLQTSEPSSARPPVATDAVADARRLQTSEPTSVEPFDCDVHSKPLQILKERDTRLYVLTELDVATGEHVTVGPKDWTLRQVNATGDNTLNAAAMWDSVDGSYIFAAVNTGPPEKPLSRLCRLDHSRLDCVEHPLTLQRPSVGAIVGDTYIYNKAVGSRVGDRFYAVHNIGGDPGPEDFTSAADAAVQISNKLWETSINDVAALVETGRDLVVDDDPNGRLVRRADMPQTGRGDAAAGYSMKMRRDAAAATWILRGDATPRLRRGYFVEMPRGDASVVMWTFGRDRVLSSGIS